MTTEEQVTEWWWQHNPSNPESPNYDANAAKFCKEIEEELKETKEA